MALLLTLAKQPKDYPPKTYPVNGKPCPHIGCVTAVERYLPPLSSDGFCRYCDHKAAP
jgi:hypothetical protein